MPPTQSGAGGAEKAGARCCLLDRAPQPQTIAEAHQARLQPRLRATRAGVESGRWARRAVPWARAALRGAQLPTSQTRRLALKAQQRDLKAGWVARKAK